MAQAVDETTPRSVKKAILKYGAAIIILNEIRGLIVVALVLWGWWK